jgi:hypothetical protein
MTPRTKANSLGGAVCAALFGFAFAAAPRSCEGGLEAYLLAGLAALVVLVAIPLWLRTDQAVARRVAMGVGFAAVGLMVWIAGLFIANVRILCRLF